MNLWPALLAACAISLLTKLAGFLAPQRLLRGPRAGRIMELLTVAMLAALVAAQTFASGRALTLDARAVALACAFCALLARVPFLAIVVLAACVAAALRALGWAA